MPGYLEALVGGILLRGAAPGLLAILMAAPPRRVVRAQLKKIYVLNERGEMAGEYILDPDCPIDYNDFLKVLPDEGIGDRGTLFVGEYVFTAFQSDKLVFVLLSRGQLSAEDIDWTSLLLTAAETQMVHRSGPSSAGTSEAGEGGTVAERETSLETREKEIAALEARVRADAANLSGRSEELARQKSRLTALADYVNEVQAAVAQSAARAAQSIDASERIVSSAQADTAQEVAEVVGRARRQWEEERKALLVSRQELEARYREATERIHALEGGVQAALGNLERERQEGAVRIAEEERARAAIESRVQDLSQRFAQMAKERLLASHRPPEGPTAAAQKVLEETKEELTKERKFLQRRAIELLDREEKVRDLEAKLEERSLGLAKREQTVADREVELRRTRTVPLTPTPGPAPHDVEEARRDIEHRVKIIQQKALELLDREEKLRKRAAELEALEARLAAKVPAR